MGSVDSIRRYRYGENWWAILQKALSDLLDQLAVTIVIY